MKIPPAQNNAYFIIEGKVKFHLEISVNKDVFFLLPSKFTDSLKTIQRPLRRSVNPR